MELTKRSDEMTIALARLLNKQPFFAVLLFDLLRIHEVVDDPVIQTAATDGRDVWVNYPWFKSLTPGQRMFLLAHEVMHPVLHHIARGANYQRVGVGPDLKTWDHKKANIAMDIVINEWLLHIGCGDLPPGGMTANHPDILPFGTFTKDDIWDEIYPKLNFPPDEGGGGSGEGGFDQHDFDGPARGDAPTEAEVRSAVAAAAQSAKMQGNLHASLERFAGELLEPQVDWRAQLRTEVTARAGRDDYTWARPNRKRLALAPHTYMPGRTSEQAGVIAAYVDTSGSIAQAELQAFMSEIASIYSDTNPEEMWIGDCSTRASEPEEVQDCSQIEGYKAKNSGGTHMPAIFRKLKDCGIHPDVCVVLTDGYTDFDQDPGFPVIWVMTTDVLAPYGKNIRIKIGG